MLKVQKGRILDKEGKLFYLRGVNVGGWLMKEAYLLHAPSFAERRFRQTFQKNLGSRALLEFDRRFRDSYITEKDFKLISSWGMTCIRVPFHYNAVESKVHTYRSAGLKYLDDCVKWAKRNKIYVILDLHAAPGCQNQDWHSDSLGTAEFWDKPFLRNRVYAMWQFLAKRYSQCEYIAGYDLLNESVTKRADLLNEYYHKAIAAIRKEDKNHILFVEGNNWATDINCLDNFKDDNYALSIHSYEPLNMTFNLVPLLSYPTNQKGIVSNKTTTRQHIQQYVKISRERNLPIYVGEFGVNYRNNRDGEIDWLEDNIKLFKEYDFHWTYWTYKAVKNFAFPDGVLSFYDNPPWVHRQGPLSGWDTYYLHWKKYKTEMSQSWKTDKFTLNKRVSETLKKYVC